MLPALAVPPLFLHVEYQPKFTVSLASATATVTLADIAIWMLVAAAAWTAVRAGPRAEQPPWILALAAGALLWIGASIAYGRTSQATTNAVSAAKFGEYMLLLWAVPLLLRRRDDVALFCSVVAAWSLAASFVGALEFFGVHIFIFGATGGRQASFLGFSDFAALSGAALLVSLVTLTGALPVSRRLAIGGLASGAVGIFAAGALAGVVGVIGGALAVVGVRLVRRDIELRAVALTGAAVATIAVATVLLRMTDLRQFVDFSRNESTSPQTHVQTYAHRTLLAYLGLRIFRDHPVVGVGWQASSEPENFRPYLADAHARYPDEPAVAFPSQTRRYGVQNAYLELLADLGVVGFVAVAALFVGGVVLAAKAAVGIGEPGIPLLALSWTILAAALWAGQGLVAGIPLDALTWIAFGLATARRQPA